jgi:hypothetical protein
MFRKDYVQRISEFEKALEQIAEVMPREAIFERAAPKDLWSPLEIHITSLKNLAEALKASMLILKPEKTHTIERVFEGVVQPLNAFKETLFQASADTTANSRRALEHLRKAIVGSYDFLILAKEIRDNPSPAIEEILKLREIYGAKEYISTVPAPEALHIRIIGLIKRAEALDASLKSLEKALDEVKLNLNKIREESLKFRSVPVRAPTKVVKKAPSASVKPTSQPSV